jgi:hypothetical protein
MGTKDTTGSHSPTVSIAPQTVTTTLNGTGVDHAGYQAAALLIALGVFAGTTPTATIQVQESDDNISFTAVSAANLANGGVIPQITPANANTMIRRGYLGLKRYLRVAVTAIAGTTPSLPLCAVVLLDSAEKQPTAASAT